MDSEWGYWNLMRPFVRYLEHKYPGIVYLWVYEKQTDRGIELIPVLPEDMAKEVMWNPEGFSQGHWHMLVSKYIDLEADRQKWFNIQKKAGLTEIWDRDHNYVPNACLTVKGVRGGKMLSNYLGKYFSKKASKPGKEGFGIGQKQIPTTGRWWGASLKLKQLEMPVFADDDETMGNLAAAAGKDEIDHYEKTIDILDNTGKPREICTNGTEWFIKPEVGDDGVLRMVKDWRIDRMVIMEIYRMKGQSPMKYLSKHLRRIYNAYMKAYREMDVEKTRRLKWQYELSMAQNVELLTDGNSEKGRWLWKVLMSGRLRCNGVGFSSIKSVVEQAKLLNSTKETTQPAEQLPKVGMTITCQKRMPLISDWWGSSRKEWLKLEQRKVMTFYLEKHGDRFEEADRKKLEKRLQMVRECENRRRGVREEVARVRHIKKVWHRFSVILETPG